MKEPDSQQSIETFDAYAAEYDAALEEGISLSGEDKDYFANARVKFLAERLRKCGYSPARIMDFGCGTGSSIPFFLKTFPKASILGADVSQKSIEIARKLHKSERVEFAKPEEQWYNGSFDLVFCNGVFHHIPQGARQSAVASISGALKHNGIFAFWENNPWNPGTRLVMSRIPFDRDAETISPNAAKRLLQKAEFSIIELTSTFYFPRFFSLLRPLEKFILKLPLGAQYMILAKK